MFMLDCPTQAYDWGSADAIPGFLRQEADGGPVAEVWVGTHPLGTAQTIDADGDRACATAREVAATHAPDEVVSGHKMGAMTLRWIHLQVLRELAQHSGHADILREQLLAHRTERA